MDIIRILNYFVIYSFFGWILESTYKSLHEKKFINSGFLVGPFCPIYGYGALIMYLFLDRFSNNLFLLFISAFLILSLFEYVVGVGLELAFHTKYWDYSRKKFNIKGWVCLENSMYWGILGVVFIKLIHPGIETLLEVIPNRVMIIFTSISIAYIFADTILTTIKLIKINIKLTKLDELTERIQSHLPHLNGVKVLNKATVLRGIVKIKKTNRMAISELAQRRDELINKIELQTKRIRRAFPNMKSERFSKYIKLPALRSQSLFEENTEDIKRSKK
ncbi:MAG: putative ABC transporter permease [Clostridia bacterium]|nr:putative ABC transporter permease [Clostridia bacterium]